MWPDEKNHSHNNLEPISEAIGDLVEKLILKLSRREERIRELEATLQTISDCKMPELPDDLRKRSIVLSGMWIALKLLAHGILTKKPEGRE